MHQTKATLVQCNYLVLDILGPLCETQGAECLCHAGTSGADIGNHEGLGVASQRILCTAASPVKAPTERRKLIVRGKSMESHHTATLEMHDALCAVCCSSARDMQVREPQSAV